ncbi:MAG: RtcB family protein [Bacteroidia bacterium]|nr:RtcB family protein [Bacteroidia bacterium]
MGKKTIKGKDLVAIGFTDGRTIGIALNLMSRIYKKRERDHKLQVLSEVLANPQAFLQDEHLGKLAAELFQEGKPAVKETPLEKTGKAWQTYGRSHIEKGAIQQMELAMRLPVTAAGALMPDAHQGYGLPIGGVLATRNAVIPYGVGVDIGCRMCLTLYDLPASFIKGQHQKLKTMLEENTRFGRAEFSDHIDHEILERKEFQEIRVVRELKDRAWKQLGSSGSGNHFVEFGVVEILDPDNEFGLPAAQYVAILSHSGSRGLGANIAEHYTKLARETTVLPRAAQNLAWLDLDTEAGQEYWLAMTLAGDYASACHHQIHQRLGRALGEKPLARVENHHNFAWKEHLTDGTEVIVHRKGATPAGKGVLGIIPGSMIHPGFIVRGKGEMASINSASHGAGRAMSRTKANQTFSNSEMKKTLRTHGVTLIGGGLDEAPMAYKDINTVMAAQQELVEVVGSFSPKIVRMDS